MASDLVRLSASNRRWSALLTAARRLKTERSRYAIVSSCAGGGLGAAMLLENAVGV